MCDDTLYDLDLVFDKIQYDIDFIEYQKLIKYETDSDEDDEDYLNYI